MKRYLYALLTICLLFITGWGSSEKLYYSSPGVIPNTLRQMKSPGFWIARQSYPDKVILEAAGVALFNLKTEKELKLIKDIPAVGPVYPGDELRSFLRKDLEGIFKQKLYTESSGRIGSSFYRDIEKQLNLGAIPTQVNVRYGFIFRYADQRVLPTEDVLTVEPGDTGFDELQNSSLDIGMPVAVLHESIDGIWAYVFSPSSSGWVKKNNIVFCASADLEYSSEKAPLAVVISAKADIFLDPGLTQYLDYVRMGAKFPVTGDTNSEITGILIPSQGKDGKFIRQTAYLRKADINIGYLAYTQRNIIQQAFKLLNAPYSWGGKNGEQDCSSFLQEIFSTAGIFLPRNSSDQGRIGEPLGELTQALPGASILQLKGHVLLYLGMFENRPYAIHETHGYSQKQRWGPDTVREVNRAIVSDLSLGEGSKKGSLRDRIISVRVIN